MWVTKDGIAPDGPPLQATEAIADTVPGFTALIGILTALVSRNETGKGQKVDVAQMDSMIGTMQSFSFWNLAQVSWMKAGRSGRVGVSGLRETSDGYVMYALTPGRITDSFTQYLGVEELTPEIVDKWVKEKTTDEVVEVFAEIGVPVAAVMDLDEVQASPQAKAREMFVKIDHPTMGEIVQPGFPIKFSETKGDISAPSPLLGEHNVEVYSKVLGLSKEKVEKLRKQGII
jgi:crotonobetainyl-CoA:carnitine CoA-transferase CaiB-like acyl-CoA transferase